MPGSHLLRMAVMVGLCLTGGSCLLHAEAVTEPRAFMHPVLERWRSAAIDPGQRKGVDAAAQEILVLSDAQVLALIPVQTPRIHHACPVCARTRPVATLPEQPSPFPGLFDPLKPDQVQCRDCRTVFPHDGFPADQGEVFRNMLGEDITVPYWEDRHGGRTVAEKLAGRPHRLYFRGVVDTARMQWLLRRMDALAQSYRSDHDERAARRLILVLEALAQRYPHYLLTTDYGHRYVSTTGRKPPYGYIDTRWGRRSSEDLPQELLVLFDLAASSPSMDAACRQRILAGLFLDPLRRLERWGVEDDDLGFYGNECPLKAMVERALVLEDPEAIHLCYQRIRETPLHATGCDALFNQSLGYGSLFRLTFFAGARLLDGYSDPPGFIGRDGSHLENIQPLREMEDYFRRLATACDQLRLPSGGWLSYDDSGPGFGPTWWSAVSGETCRPLTRSGNVLLPGLRRAVLGAGSGDRQIQVALDFAEHGVNHGHQSGLAMQIYAFGHSLVDDFPYHKSILRRYAEMTVGHPTVVIDHRNQEDRHTAGDVELYAPLMEGVSAIRVDDTRAYQGLATRYARTLVLNASDPDAPYVIDIFEVVGGTLHDYHLRSSAQHRSSASASLATQALPGPRPLLPPGESWVEPRAARQPVGSGYGVLLAAGRAAIPGPFHFTSACDEPWAMASEAKDAKDRLVGAYRAGTDSWPDRPAVGIRHHVAVGAGYEFITASSPSLVEVGFHGVDGKPTEAWPTIPHRIIRHQVPVGGSSVFVVVHEPYHHAPRILAVTRLDQGDDHLVALRIESPGRVDTLLYALDRPRPVAIGGLAMSGRLALVSRQEGQAPRALLIEGTRLTAEGVDLACAAGDHAGAITAMERCWQGKGIDRLRVTADPPLPAGDGLRGTWMLVRLGSWNATVNGARNEKSERRFAGATQAVAIDHVTVEGDGTWVHLAGDHGLMLRDDGVEEAYWPHRTFNGGCRFLIPTSATTHPSPSPSRPQPLVIAPAASVPADLKPGMRVGGFTGAGHDAEVQWKTDGSSPRQTTSAHLASWLAAMTFPGGIRMEGWLQVPADGVYAIHGGCAGECRVTMGGVTVIEDFRGYSLMPGTRTVRLVAGWYPVRVECFRGAERPNLPFWAVADWEGPGLPRQDLLPSCSVP